ncbi:MAG: alpha-2-macroglobulin family protein, partial [Clostridia bacterium]|nr:alpha-2-macroglobulin family protein [Clostridia bacterium]
GRFEKHKKTLVFIPKQLEAETLYTVTLKKGVPLLDSAGTLSADYCFSFETAKTEKEDKFSWEMDDQLVEFSTSEEPFFSVYFSSRAKIPSVNISLYCYADDQVFSQVLQKRDKIPSWSYLTRKNYREDLSRLTKYGEYQTEFHSVDSYSHYLIFPEKLPGGYYVAEIKAGEALRQVWFQVTDLAVYVVQDAEKSLFWVNDLKTKKPVVGATVSLEKGKHKVQGNEEGVIVVEQKRDGKKESSAETGYALEQKEYALVQKGTQQIVVPLVSMEQSTGPKQIKSSDYWKYLYLDRELFKPGDTVNFWGVVAPRKGAEPLSEVVVELRGNSRGYYQRGENAPILSQKVRLDQEIFTGGLKLPVLNPGYYYLAVKAGETTLLSNSFSVETYQKPAYKISVEPEKKAIFAGEKVNFQARAAFFEGTPVPRVSLNYNIWEQKETVETNAQGVATIPFLAPRDSNAFNNFFSPYNSFYLGLSTSLPEVGEIYTYSNLWVFASKVYLEGEVKREGEDFVLTAQLSHVDLAKINQGEDLNRDNFVSGPAAGYPLKGKIYQDVWEKEGEGWETYNFITKTVEKRYNYRHSVKQVGELAVVTDEQGQATYRGTWAFAPENSYYLELTAQDKEGRPIKHRISITQNSQGRNDYYKYYYLQTEKEGQKFIPGEQVTLLLKENEQSLNSRKSGYLFYQGQKVIADYHVLNQAQYSFNFKEEDIPNTNVGAVYFDGTVYQEAYPLVVPFDLAQKELKMTIKTDQQEYRPKDKVKLNVQVTDTQDKPVRAKVNLNLVDEALYSMRDQQVNLLASLYTDYLLLSVRTRASHLHPDYHGGAECGGEGESERKDFPDTVLFTTVETDSRGRASTEFTLPDNLTSWRLTYHGVTSDLQAGSGTYQIPVRLPFFVEMVFKETYLAGDAPVVLVRSFGEKVNLQTPVTYEMVLTTPTGEKVVQKAQGAVAESCDWQLPALKEGKYALTVAGKAGEYQDKLKKEFTVVHSFLERTVSTHQLLEENLKLAGSTLAPTVVVFSDYEKSQYLRGLYNLVWQAGTRLEQKLAAQEARRLLAQYFQDKKAFAENSEEESLLIYQQYNGGVSILPYAESEPALTALAASVGSKDFDYRAMTGYFYNLLEKGEEKGEDVTLALWGLGALGEPVLLEINNYLTQEDLAPAEKIHLALALLDIGDGAYAQKVYAELLQQHGEKLGNSLRIKVGRDQDEIITATTQMALLAARLEAPEKNLLYQYILENPGKEILNNLEQVQILKYNLRYMESGPVSFTYELNGKKEKKTLEGRETFTLYVLPQDLAKIKFSKISGEVGVMTVYSQPYVKEEIAARNDLQVKRTYVVKTQQPNTFQRGDLVEVVLDFEVKDLAPGGRYEVVDVLPAGLSYVKIPQTRAQKLSRYWRYPSEVKGQKITFNVGKGKEPGKIVYYARVVSPGEFIAQGTLLNHLKNKEICILGQEERVVIK